MPKSFSSKNYWEDRYVSGRNSGAGSYGRLAKFKAKTINKLVKLNGIETVLELGCGDGNQLGLAKYPFYTGYDVSEKAISICSETFHGDDSKEFIVLNSKTKVKKADLTMSLDVIYHLIEDKVFESHMNTLFDKANKMVIIYASNGLKMKTAQHVKHREFVGWIEKNIKGWKLDRVIKNKYPYNPRKPDKTSFADFYIYKKK